MSKEVKKGRLSKVEEFYIHNNMKDKSVQDIAADLGRSVAVVSKYIAGKQEDPINSPDTEAPTTIPSPSEPVETPPADPVDAAITGTQYNGPLRNSLLNRMRVRDGRNGRKIGAIMTESASIDSGKVSVKDGAFVVKDQPKPKNRYTDGAIFKPLGEDAN